MPQLNTSFVPDVEGTMNGALTKVSKSFEALGNQFFLGPLQGGLVLMAIGLVGALAKKALDLVSEWLLRQVVVRVQIDSRDDAYRWMAHWLATHPAAAHSRNLSVSTTLAAFGSTAPGSTTSAGVLYMPAPGDHLTSYGGRWVWITRKRNAANPQSPANARLLMETMQVTLLGRDTQVAKALIEHARAVYEASQRERTCVYTVDSDGYWMAAGTRPSRPVTSVVLPRGVAAALMADCQEFLSAEAWYAHHGVPYRRGYLLHGPPGTGKTSLVKALAGGLGLSIYVITLSSPTVTDDSLRELLSTARDRGILLLEDVDAAFTADRQSAAGGGSGSGGGLSFSGLLNAVDGVAAQEGKLLFMTTNHIARLDAALIRPGRVDVRCEFRLCTREQVHALFMHFYSGFIDRGQAPGAFPSPSDIASESDGRLGSDRCCNGRRTGHDSAPSNGLDSMRREGGALTGSVSDGPQASMQEGQTSGAVGDSHTSQEGRHGGRREPGWLTGVSRQGSWQGDRAALERLAAQFASAVPEDCVSPAALQGYFMQHKQDPGAAVARVHELLDGLSV